MTRYVTNEMTGLVHPVHEDVYDAHKAWIEAKRSFEFFCKYQHDSSSIFSALVHKDLMAAMDSAYRRFHPYTNEWYIAKKGYSLN